MNRLSGKPFISVRRTTIRSYPRLINSATQHFQRSRMRMPALTCSLIVSGTRTQSYSVWLGLSILSTLFNHSSKALTRANFDNPQMATTADASEAERWLKTTSTAAGSPENPGKGFLQGIRPISRHYLWSRHGHITTRIPDTLPLHGRESNLQLQAQRRAQSAPGSSQAGEQLGQGMGVCH